MFYLCAPGCFTSVRNLFSWETQNSSQFYNKPENRKGRDKWRYTRDVSKNFTRAGTGNKRFFLFRLRADDEKTDMTLGMCFFAGEDYIFLFQILPKPSPVFWRFVTSSVCICNIIRQDAHHRCVYVILFDKTYIIGVSM